MTMLMKVYSPDGTMFEVTPVRAKKLTLQHGWTFSPKPQPLFKKDSPLNGTVPTVTKSTVAASTLTRLSPVIPISTTVEFPEYTETRKKKKGKGDEQ